MFLALLQERGGGGTEQAGHRIEERPVRLGGILVASVLFAGIFVRCADHPPLGAENGLAESRRPVPEILVDHLGAHDGHRVRHGHARAAVDGDRAAGGSG